jgi:broad specificity phosphatase PhoE
LYLIRHAATANNRARPPRLQGRRTNPELSAEGLEQARHTARLLADCRLEVVYSSPLARAMQTARLVAEPHRVEVQPLDWLVEIDVGEWEGLSWEEVERTHPDASRAFVENPCANPYLGGECLEQVHRRVVEKLKQLVGRHTGQTVAVVAHNMVNRVFMLDLLGLPLNNYRSIPQSNCGVSAVRFLTGQAKLLTLNSVLHLDDA